MANEKDSEKEQRKQKIAEFMTALQEAVQLVEPTVEITAKPMFGGAGYYADGLLFAMWYGEGLALKLTEADAGALLEIPGSAPSYNPANIEVPEAYLSAPQSLSTWVEKSLAYVRTQKPAARKKKA